MALDSFFPSFLKKWLLFFLLTVEDLHESFAKFNIEGGINNWVDSTVDVSKPRKGAVHCWGDVAIAVHVQDVGDEKWEPADDENTWGKKNKQIVIAENWKISETENSKPPVCLLCLSSF